MGNGFSVSELNLTSISWRFNLVMVAETGCQQLFFDMIITVGSLWKFMWGEEKKESEIQILMRNGPSSGLISRGSIRKTKMSRTNKIHCALLTEKCRRESKKWSIVCFNERHVHSKNKLQMWCQRWCKANSKWTRLKRHSYFCISGLCGGLLGNSVTWCEPPQKFSNKRLFSILAAQYLKLCQVHLYLLLRIV